MPSKPNSRRYGRGATTAAVLAVLVVSAGCSGGLLGGDFTFRASPASVDAATQDETGFQHLESRVFWINRTREIRGQEVQVNVSNHVAVYTKSTEVGGEQVEYAGFVAFTSPEANVLGQPMNPLARMSKRELVMRAKSQLGAMAGDRFGELKSVEAVGSEPVAVLGEETTATAFRAEGETRSGTEVVARFYVAKVRHGGDVVVLVGAYPTSLGEGASSLEIDETDAILGMMESVEHEA